MRFTDDTATPATFVYYLRFGKRADLEERTVLPEVRSIYHLLLRSNDALDLATETRGIGNKSRTTEWKQGFSLLRFIQY